MLYRSTSQLPQRNNSAKKFPYSDPTRTDDKVFTSRMLELAKLECETVKHEAIGRWAYQVPPTTSTSASSCNMPSSVSSTTQHPSSPLKPNTSKVGVVTRKMPREARSKSAKTKAEVDSEAKRRTGHRHRHKSSSTIKTAKSISYGTSGRERSSPTKKCNSTQSMFDLQAPSEADLQSLGSLNLVIVEEISKAGKMDKAKTAATSTERRFMSRSSSSSNLKGHKSSQNKTACLKRSKRN